MIQQEIIGFLKNLKKNNNKAWFDAHKKTYEEAKSAFLVSVEDILKALSKIDPELENLTAKECVFRINRDVRFSKDKQPYKNNMAAYFNRAGKKGTGAGYYLHIEPGQSFAAAGIWMPEGDGLQKIRQEIDYNLDDWKKLISTTTFKKHFAEGIDKTNILVRPPKGYDEQNPAIEFLKLKSFVVRKSFSDGEITSSSFTKELSDAFKAAKPMIAFINKSLD